MKEKVTNFAWKLGVRLFRATRKVNLSSKLQPAFVKVASLVPTTKHATVATLSNGSKLWMPPGYRDTRTVVTGLFQEDETRLVERLTRPGGAFIDVGAYVGYFTILASTLVGSKGRVYAFEPDDLAFSYLLRNIEVNRCTNTIPVNKGVSDGASTSTLIRDPTGPESYLTKAPVHGHSLVETITIDSFFEAEQWPTLDVMKLNIEGSELPALTGMREMSRRNPGLHLIMECNPSAMVRAGVDRHELESTLADLGFRRGQVVERGLQEVPYPDLLPRGDAVYNILLTK